MFSGNALLYIVKVHSYFCWEGLGFDAHNRHKFWSVRIPSILCFNLSNWKFVFLWPFGKYHTCHPHFRIWLCQGKCWSLFVALFLGQGHKSTYFNAPALAAKRIGKFWSWPIDSLKFFCVYILYPQATWLEGIQILSFILKPL